MPSYRVDISQKIQKKGGDLNNEVVVDVSDSALATLKKERAGKWKIEFPGYWNG
jgi:hypothetical protein